MLRLKKLAALALVAAFTLTACSSGPVEAESTDLVEGRIVLTDTASSPSPYEPESPAIDAEPFSTETKVVNVSADAFADVPPEPENGATPVASSKRTVTKISGEVRAVWISYLDLAPILTGKSEKQFTTSIQSMFDNVKQYGLNTLYVQVRPFGDALYESSYFPYSYLCTGTEGKNPGFDPLAIMVREAKSRSLRIEAWLNPYRVRAAGSDKALAASNQAQKWLNAGDSAVIQYDGTISYNPASKKAQDLIINGAVEIVRNYAVDGIHIDDYFYPHTAAAFDKSSYASYTGNGGSLSLANWRRSNVEAMIKKLYAAIKAENANVAFGISPQSSVYNNYNAQYLDVEKIVSTKGYCDYICPQIYFGFENGTQPYAETLDSWSKMIQTSAIDLYVGLGAYKCGVKDSWAGNGVNEWAQNKDLLGQMVTYARDVDHYKGFAVYRYDSLFNPDSGVSGHIKTEAANLKKLF